MRIIRIQSYHVPRMAELEALCFSNPWNRTMILSELTNPIGYYLGAEINGLLIGYAGMQVVVDEGYITNVAVDPEFRRRGVADTLLRALHKHALERTLSFMTLEVRKSNRGAQALYARHGFVVDGVRPGYYEKPKEDALIMTLRLEEAQA